MSVESSLELRARHHRVRLHAGEPRLMGIVNTNPGSFSDRTHLATFDEQLSHAMALVEAGADVIDIGSDSGVTYSEQIDVEVQVGRVVPLVRSLVERGVIVSVDTCVREVAEAALEVGAAIINDVSGLADPAIARLCAESGAALVLLHTRAAHKEERFPRYRDVVADVELFLRERVEYAGTLGMERSRLLLDPGLDYAKLPHESVAVLQAYDRLTEIGLPLLSGVSRKYFAGIITGVQPADRLPETLATVAAIRSYPGILRVHDVAEVRRYLDVVNVIEGARPFPSYDLDDDRMKWIRGDDTPAEEARSAGEEGSVAAT